VAHLLDQVRAGAAAAEPGVLVVEAATDAVPGEPLAYRAHQHAEQHVGGDGRGDDGGAVEGGSRRISAGLVVVRAAGVATARMSRQIAAAQRMAVSMSHAMPTMARAASQTRRGRS